MDLKHKFNRMWLNKGDGLEVIEIHNNNHFMSNIPQSME